MSDIGSIRGSAAPLAVLCPGSVRTTAVQIARTNAAAESGREFHERMTRIVRNLPVEVPEDDVEGRVLVAHGRACWDGLREAFPAIETEVALSGELSGVRVTGHLDGLSVDVERRRAQVLDWKSGRSDADHNAQLQVYAFLVFQAYPEVERISVTVVWVREREHETVHLARSEGVGAWAADFTRRVILWDGVYHPGAHCLHCPRSHECPAVVAEGRRDVAIFAEQPPEQADIEAGVNSLAPDALIALVRRARAVAKMAERVVDAARLRVGRDGEVVGSGSSLVLAEQSSREVDVGKAWPVLQAHLTDAELAPMLKVSIGKAEDRVAKKAIEAPGAKRGAGKRAVEAFEAALDAAGAIDRTPTRVLRERRRN